MAIEGLERLLAEHPFFEGLGAGYIRLLAGCAANSRFPAGRYIFREGDAADRFYLIRAGSAALEIAAPGWGPLIVETIHAGDILGYSWLFPPYRMRFDARAVEEVRALAFDAACLRGKCDDDPRLGYELMKRFSQVLLDRLQATRLQVLDVYGRVGTP